MKDTFDAIHGLSGLITKMHEMSDNQLAHAMFYLAGWYGQYRVLSDDDLMEAINHGAKVGHREAANV